MAKKKPHQSRTTKKVVKKTTTKKTTMGTPRKRNRAKEIPVTFVVPAEIAKMLAQFIFVVNFVSKSD